MGVLRISSSHLNDHNGLMPPLDTGNAEDIFSRVPVFRATPIKASFMATVLGNLSLGLYCKAVLTTASISTDTFVLIRRIGRSPNENGGSRRGSRRVKAWCKVAPRE